MVCDESDQPVLRERTPRRRDGDALGTSCSAELGGAKLPKVVYSTPLLRMISRVRFHGR